MIELWEDMNVISVGKNTGQPVCDWCYNTLVP